MSQENSAFWDRARLAQDKLTNQFLNHPDVSLIDIGYTSEQGQSGRQVVLRIHVRERWLNAKPEERVAFPKQVDNIPVTLMLEDYQLEIDASAANQQ